MSDASLPTAALRQRFDAFIAANTHKKASETDFRRKGSLDEKMVRFYLSKDATEMMDFLAGCHPDAEAILPPPEEDRDHDSGMEP